MGDRPRLKRSLAATVLALLLSGILVAGAAAEGFIAPTGSWALTLGQTRFRRSRGPDRTHSRGYTPVSVQLAPECVELSCPVRASVTLLNGKKLSLTLRYPGYEYTHESREVKFPVRVCGHPGKLSFFLGVSVVGDVEGKPQALAGLARAEVYGARCRPPEGSGFLARLTGTLKP